MILENIKLLLVEDDNFIGDMLERKLLAEGAICTRAFNGQDGLTKLQEGNYDFSIIITDVMMAVMDGYEMVKEIKQREQAQHIPIVVLTNKVSLTTENVKIKDLGIESFLIKSNTPLGDLVILLAEIAKKNSDV